nr:N-acetyltransferase [Cryptomonas curvata]
MLQWKNNRKYKKYIIRNGDFLPNIGISTSHYLQFLTISIVKNNFKINTFPIFPIVYECNDLYKKKHSLLNKFKEFRYFYKNPIYLKQLRLFSIFCKITKANMLLFLKKKDSNFVIELSLIYIFKNFQDFIQTFFRFLTKIKIIRNSKKLQIYIKINFIDKSLFVINYKH